MWTHLWDTLYYSKESNVYEWIPYLCWKLSQKRNSFIHSFPFIMNQYSNSNWVSYFIFITIETLTTNRFRKDLGWIRIITHLNCFLFQSNTGKKESCFFYWTEVIWSLKRLDQVFNLKAFILIIAKRFGELRYLISFSTLQFT